MDLLKERVMMRSRLSRRGPFSGSGFEVLEGRRLLSASVVAAALPQAPVGSVEDWQGVFTGVGIGGWAADFQAVGTPLVVQMYIDGILRESKLADFDRADLQQLLGATNHGYGFWVPALPAGTHTLTVVTYD